MPAKTKKSNGRVLATVGNLAEQDAAGLRESVRVASTDELKAELARLLGFSADNLLRLAIITQELESRGVDLSSIRLGLLPLLRQIACGKLLPEIVVMFAGTPAAIHRLCKLPITEQREIAEGRKVFTSLRSTKRKGCQEKADYAFDENDATEAAIFHMNELGRLLSTEGIERHERFTIAFSNLSVVIAKFTGAVNTNELRAKAARVLAGGKKTLKGIAREVKESETLIESLLDHEWFKHIDDEYYLSIPGRHAVCD